MSEQQPPEHEAPGAESSIGDGPSRGWYVAVPAIALLLGMVLGGLVVGVAQNGLTGSSEPAATPSSTNPSPTEEVTVVVPQECLEAANTVRDATQLLSEGVDAVRDFRPDDLLDLLDRLEALDTLAREQADSCSQTNVN